MAQLQSKTSEEVDQSTVMVVSFTPTVPRRIDLAIEEAFALVKQNAEQGIAIAIEFEFGGTRVPRISADADRNSVFKEWNAQNAADHRRNAGIS